MRVYEVTAKNQSRGIESTFYIQAVNWPQATERAEPGIQKLNAEYEGDGPWRVKAVRELGKLL